jgi:hypothetical protein
MTNNIYCVKYECEECGKIGRNYGNGKNIDEVRIKVLESTMYRLFRQNHVKCKLNGIAVMFD